ncbi:MAG: hypothetical protein ACRCZL_03465 [Cetobacterium sp.]
MKELMKEIMEEVKSAICEEYNSEQEEALKMVLGGILFVCCFGMGVAIIL